MNIDDLETFKGLPLHFYSNIRDGRDRKNIKLTRLDMITIYDRDRIIVLVQRLLI